MSDRQVDVTLKLIDQFTKPLQTSIDKLTAVGREGDKTRRQLNKIGQSLEKTGAKLTAAVTMPIVGLGAASYKTFESVDKQLSLVKATMGDTAYATADLSGALQDAAVQSIYSMEEGASALVNYARQGFNAAEAADMLTPALNLAAGTATELDSVTSGLGNTLKAFGASSEEATHYADMFTQAQAQANTNVQGLFDAMAIAGPIAKTVGWEFEDIATLTGVFGDASIDASEGANALKTGLARLAAPAKQGSEAMKKLGINIFNADGTMKAMPEVIGELQKGFNGLSEQESLAAASAIFGKNQMSKWLALINGPGVDGLQEMRDQISGASGNAQGAADAMVTPLEKLSSTFDVFRYSVGNAIAEAVIPFIEKATELVDKFRQMSPEQQQQIIKWAAMAAAVGPVLMGIGRMIKIFSTLFGALSKIRGAFTALVKAGSPIKALAAALGAPLGIVVAVMAAIAAVVVVVITHLDQFKAAAARVMQVVGPAIQNLMSAFQSFGSAVSPILTLIGDLVANALCDAFVTAGTIIANVINVIAAVIQTLAPIVSAIVSNVVAIINGDWSSAWNTSSGIVQGAVTLISSIIGGIAGIIRGVITIIQGIMNGDWSAVWNGMSGIVTSVVGTITGALNGIIGIINGIISAAKKAGEALSSMGNGVSAGGLHGVGRNASGTPNWRGGWTTVGEKGPELMNLPRGTQIVPHEASLNKAANSGSSISIAKLADTIVVREDADIERIGDAVVRKLRVAGAMRGGYSFGGDMA